MKYLKSFNESRTSHKLQESDIQEILDIFTELVDEGFDLINKDSGTDQFYNPAESEITYQLSTSFLDDKGKDEYKSKYFDSIRGSWNYTVDKWKIKNKHFDYYQDIIFNVNIGNKDEAIWGKEKAAIYKKGDLEGRNDPRGYKIFPDECEEWLVVKWSNKIGDVVIADYGCCFPKL